MNKGSDISCPYCHSVCQKYNFWTNFRKIS